MSRRVRTAVLISGTGTNMSAIVDAANAADAPFEVVMVVSNVAGVEGLDRAASAGMPVATVPHADYPDRASFEAALHERLVEADVELVVLAGFMRILTASFVKAWEGRMINIHPSLLPRHKGLHTHERVLEAGDARHGATVHWVVPELDSGAVIAQSGFDVAADDDPVSLAARVKTLEHELYPRAVADVATALLSRGPRTAR